MAALNQFTVGFLAIPSVNKHLVIQLARCEYVDQRENVIAVRNSGSDKTHVALGLGLGLAACQRGLSVGFTTAASLVHTLVEARDERRRAWLRAAVQDRGQATVRSLQPALRERIGPGHHQPALRRVDRGLRLGAAHRCTPDRLTHRVHILEVNGESYLFKLSRQATALRTAGDPADA